jgi:hypothetical protein
VRDRKVENVTDIIDRAKHLLEGVTDGPWKWDEWPDCSQIGSPTGQLLAVTPSVLMREQSSTDARFIAATRELVPALVAEIERLRTELTQDSRVEEGSHEE